LNCTAKTSETSNAARSASNTPSCQPCIRRDNIATILLPRDRCTKRYKNQFRLLSSLQPISNKAQHQRKFEAMSKTQCQTTWARWDNAWELGVSTSDRVAILKDCAVPDFKYSNPDIEFAPGDFEAIANWIEPALNAYGGKITVKPLKWHEHHRRSASQWDSKFPAACVCL
jgi:hypothetical protein